MTPAQRHESLMSAAVQKAAAKFQLVLQQELERIDLETRSTERKAMNMRWEKLPADVKRIALDACSFPDGSAYENTHVECAVRAILADRSTRANKAEAQS